MDRRTVLRLMAGGAAALIPTVKPAGKPTKPPKPTSTPLPISVRPQGGDGKVIIRPRTRTATAGQGAPYGGAVTHGDQLTTNHVGPWTLQGVSKGSETLDSSLSDPGRGYWRFDTPDEFSSTTAWPSNANDSNPSILNATSLHEGTVTGSPVTIDGYSIPVGTRIVQFRVMPNQIPFYAQGTSLKVLFRGCRFRWTNGLGGEGLFNDNVATSSQQVMLHYCDVGLLSREVPAASEGEIIIKFIGGLNHRLLRNHQTLSATFNQPNVSGCEYTENYIDDMIYPYGAGGPNSDFLPKHLNGISSEGGLTSIKILRNRIIAPSPDGATGSTGTALGQPGYGTQSGQTGYGSGTNPGRLVDQTDCIALFSGEGLNIGDGVTGLQIKDNYLGGAGYCVYAGSAGAQNLVMTGNTFTTRYWTDGGNFGAVTATPTWGSNGNSQSNNVWADDYGTGGNGATATANRQYPSGNGPRVGASVI